MPSSGPPDTAVTVRTGVLIGLCAGLLAGTFGVGGGILIVPGLVLFAGMAQRRAHGTSLAAFVPISMSSLASYALQGNVDWAVGACLAAGALGGAVIGTKLLAVLPPRTLGVLFTLVLVVSAVRLFGAEEAAGRSPLTVVAAGALVLIGLMTGILAGLLGVGGGVVMVPIMILGFGLPPVVAKGTSAAVIIPTALMGTWRNRRHDNTDLRAALAIGLAGLGTAAVGGVIADRMGDTVSNVLFAALLLVVAVRLALQLRDQPGGAGPA